MIEHLSQLIFNVYEAFTVAFYVRTGGSLLCRSAVTFSQSFDKRRTLSVENSLPGWVLKHNEPLIIPYFDKDESTLGYYGGSEDIKSFMGYPLDSRGVLVVDSKKKYAFTDKEKKILASFVSLMGDELERERKTEELEEEVEAMKIGRRMIGLCRDELASETVSSDIIGECLSFGGAHLGFVALEKSGRLFVESAAGTGAEGVLKKECTMGSSVVSTILEGGREFLLPFGARYLKERSLFFDGEPAKARQLFAFPLKSDDMPFGVAGLVSYGDEPLKERSISVLRDAAALLSLYYKSLWMKEYVRNARDIDNVTGSMQFPSFLRIAERILNEKRVFSLLSFTLTNVPNYYRHLGIGATEGLLGRMADTLKFCSGKKGVVARESNGHFYVLLKESDPVEARNMLKIIHYAVLRSITTQGDWQKEGAMLQSGLASFPRDSGNLWELIGMADSKTMYTH